MAGVAEVLPPMSILSMTWAPLVAGGPLSASPGSPQPSIPAPPWDDLLNSRHASPASLPHPFYLLQSSFNPETLQAFSFIVIAQNHPPLLLILSILRIICQRPHATLIRILRLASPGQSSSSWLARRQTSGYVDRITWRWYEQD